MQDICRWGDRITTQEEAQACFLGSGDQTIRGCLVSIHVHVDAGSGLLALDPVGRDRSVDIVSVVITIGQRLDVRLSDNRLLGELVLQHVHCRVERTLEQPANQSEGEHVLATERGFVIETKLGQSLFHE